MTPMKHSKRRNEDEASLNMNPPTVISIGVFILIFTVIQLLYTGVIAPAAEAALAAMGTAAATNPWVVMKDLEQQLCVSLGLYCAFLIGYKWVILKQDEPLNKINFLQDPDDPEKILTIDEAYKELIDSESANTGPMTTWINCIRRFKNTNNVQNAADAIRETVESIAAQLEAGNSMIRYFIWAIPSIGFVGTVRGIGAALGKAEQAVSGDISGMVDKLGLAFNSTLVSLLISLVLMLLLHILNSRQDQMVIKTQEHCESKLLTHLHTLPVSR